jgi:hypothetical protein
VMRICEGIWGIKIGGKDGEDGKDGENGKA